MKKNSLKIFCFLLAFNCFSQQKNDNELQRKTNIGKTIQVFTTAENLSNRLSPSAEIVFEAASQPVETEISVVVEPRIKFQKFMGIGGAVTDASAEVFAQLSKEKQQEFLNAYYTSDKGIGYTLLRTSIHSSDFGSGSYTYIKEGDKELKTFSIEPDRKYRIPMIKRAITAAGGKLLTYVAPWSPPAFMKNTNNMLKGGVLLPEYNQVWADYYAKFIKAYEKEGIPIWGTSTQNEPLATQTWESCLYTAEAERDFIKKYLGPTLKKEGLGDKKIIAWDHNRDLMFQRASVIYSDPEASKYVWGLGFHWYETWTGAEQNLINVAKVHEAYPDKNLMFTEGCIEKFDPAKYQFWPNAERYGISMINDFNNGTTAWTDWNILLDQKGGPNHVGNFCFAPIHADTATGELIYTPSYYYIGHFSKFIKPNAQRISSAVSRTTLSSTSFINTDGKIVTVIMNATDASIDYSLYVNNSKAKLQIPAHGIQTLIY
ncbi:glycoside hydrolase family 30 protein [Flavobacterium sp. HJJ]|uniref:glycoside hydrolase family 30 protein n=1 Tax=Flavobacterium sp. HJJ TaxID=2783792 RepID=UPI001889EC1C|nr:glycoside hydrolase family 30 protein [Flavobacterium sp. HJJ]MBF4470113.1 glycoside hydrolase family 30 protein [Flavobacterium sp. HJJ]